MNLFLSTLGTFVKSIIKPLTDGSEAKTPQSVIDVLICLGLKCSVYIPKSENSDAFNFKLYKPPKISLFGAVVESVVSEL